MTSNQIAYWKNVETNRHNEATEQETNRANIAKESETFRDNVARLNATIAYNKEQARHNQSVEAETQRNNDLNFLLGAQRNAETERSNRADEAENHRANVARESENHRHNTMDEQTRIKTMLLGHIDTVNDRKARISMNDAQLAVTAAHNADWLDYMNRSLIESKRHSEKVESQTDRQLDELERNNSTRAAIEAGNVFFKGIGALTGAFGGFNLIY